MKKTVTVEQVLTWQPCKKYQDKKYAIKEEQDGNCE